MYFKRLFPLVLMLSKTLAFYPMNRFRPNTHMVLRMKKSAADSFSFDNIISNRKSSRRTKSLTPAYKPRSENQKAYVTYLGNASVPIVFGIGPAGCGKTLFACVTAIEGLRSGDFQKIILTRPVVPVEEEELGFLPGTLVKKMDPWTRPLMDIFLEYFPQHELDHMISSGVIEISPLAYMRGRTFKRCFIIADEMQNSSPGQMLMLTTRIGDGSKMVITGDLKQSDRSLQNGLLDIMNKIKFYKNCVEKDVGIEMVEMCSGDIERSPIVSKILEIFNAKQSDDVLGLVTGTSNSTGGSLLEYKAPSSMNFVNSNTKSIIRPRAPNYDDAALIPLEHVSKNLML